jgi:hypothetical protein
MSTTLNAEKDSGKWIPVMDRETDYGKLIPEGENQFRKLVSETSLKENSGIFTKINPKADPENDTIPEKNSGIPGIRHSTHHHNISKKRYEKYFI